MTKWFSDKCFIRKYINYLSNKKLYVLACTSLYGLIIFSPFLKNARWTNDSYCVSIFGYEYMWRNRKMIQQGRPLSLMFYWVLDFFNIPINVTVYVSAFISMIFLSLSSYVMFFIIDKYIDIKRYGNHAVLVAIIGCISIFFNLFILESFLFLENSIMSLGILLTVLSCFHIVKNGKKGYIACLLLLVSGVFCYQSDVAYFLPLVLVALCVKYQANIRLIFKDFIASSIIYLISLGLNYCFIRFCVVLLKTSDTRIVGSIDIINNLRRCFYSFMHFAINHFGFTPDFAYTIIISTLLVVLIYNTVKFRNIIALLVFIIAFSILGFCSLLPHVLMSGNFYILPRSFVAISSIGGLIIVCISTVAKRVNAVTLFVCICYIIFLSQTQIDIQMNHYANYKLDNQEIMHIANRVYDYERLNDTTIDNVYITFHEPVNYYRSYTTEYTNLTSRILTCSWMVHPLINHYLQRDYSENYIDYSEFESLFNNVNDASNNMIKFSDQNYDETLNYKMIFAKRALYICIF